MTDLFVRKATGLVRSWSVFDAFVYAFFSINLVTLGLYIFSFGYFVPDGSLIPAILISVPFLIFEVIVYAALIAIMPRAGGDYVWQSRILGGPIGFVLAVTGWWFILWHWVPLYGTMLSYMVFTPLFAIAGAPEIAFWFSSADGLFWSSIITIVLVSVFIAVGMRTYARIQRWCFYGGAIGLAIVFILLLTNSQASFQSAFDNQATALFNAPTEAYAGTLKAATDYGYTPPPFSSMPLGPSLLLIPFVLFFNLWSNWGATLYGEVRGATDFKRNIYSMGGALLVTTVIVVALLSLVAKTMGWEFYNAANAGFWNPVYDSAAPAGPLGVFPYPGLLAAMLVDNPVIQFLIVFLLGLWWFGWAGTVFLSSTRVVFAAAFDRLLPEKITEISPTFNTPIYALLLMAVPSAIVSYLYSYYPGFSTLTLDTTLVIAVTYLGTTVAATILPYVKPDLYNASPVAKYKVAGIPLITIAGVIFGGFLIYNLYLWFTNSLYGVNNPLSLIYMGVMYLLAIVIYVIAYFYRKSRGIDMNKVQTEIPVE